MINPVVIAVVKIVNVEKVFGQATVYTMADGSRVAQSNTFGVDSIGTGNAYVVKAGSRHYLSQGKLSVEVK